MDKVEGGKKIGQIQWSWVIEINNGMENFYKRISQYKITVQMLLSCLSSSATSSNSKVSEMNHQRETTQQLSDILIKLKSTEVFLTAKRLILFKSWVRLPQGEGNTHSADLEIPRAPGDLLGCSSAFLPSSAWHCLVSLKWCSGLHHV